MKTTIEELAIFGGAPAFEEKLHVGRPNIGNRDGLMKRMGDLLDRRWLTNDGPFVQEFEAKVAEHIGVKHCIAMCNATIALEIAIRALGMTGEVIIPSFTFVATAHALQWQEITPVFCDIDPETHTIDPGQIERLITPRTTGIIAVHLWGNACDIEALAEIAERRGLKLLYDAAHAFSCTSNGRMIGSFGDAEVLSFHATKFFNTFEGGAVVTDNDELAAKIRLMKNFGFAGYDNVIYIGTNGKMTEPCAAMGLASFESIEEFISVNRRNYEQYRAELSDLPGVKLMELDDTERRNYQYIVTEIDQTSAHISRDALLAILWKENVIARKYFYPGCHRMEPYRSYYPHAGLLLETTESVASRVLLLPNGTAVGQKEIEGICGIIRHAVRNGSEISARLARSASAPAFANAVKAVATAGAATAGVEE